jgi:hypothetical protein
MTDWAIIFLLRGKYPCYHLAMADAIRVDGNGLRYKNADLEQYDYYDSELMTRLSSKYDKRIGSFLITFGELEHSIECAIAFLISDRSDDFGLRVIMGLTYKQKVDLFNSFCKAYLVAYEKGVELVKLKELVKRLALAAEARNVVAHAKWMSLDTDGFVRSKVILDSDAFIQFRCYKLTPTILYAQERKILKLIRGYGSFLESNGLI